MSRYPFQASVPIRYKDLDSYGHVNNAVYVTYLEEARVAFFSQVFGLAQATDFDFILARVELDYRRPLRLGELLRVGVRVESIGRTSYVLGYELTVEGELVATGRTVQVCFDYGKNAKMPVPESFRERVKPYLAS